MKSHGWLATAVTLLGFVLFWAIVWLAIFSVSLALHRAKADSWSSTKDRAAEVYRGHRVTLYCDCEYNGSNRIEDCDFTPRPKWKLRARRMEWEHIAPAALTPAHDMACWKHGGRRQCQRDEKAQWIIFDLHNLAPSVGQLNAYRSNEPYGEVEQGVSWGDCTARDGKDTFEPPDRVKGDVARVWLYMHEQYGLRMTEAQLAQMRRWSADDPVDCWECERDRRIHSIQGTHNPFVAKDCP